eukprot:CAMPEP_0113700364 /NCGR_PEP_ID=MMETSP0038_2-20120614/23910_1 /TAXON_ID=2898 /ORGANISM="Cryptomonas paramecium" /LENGTH=34 /DNA_ID=CAMNT_0000624001 /DNA_START=58 /DNA_END=159 /DNA_ORIENTATION=+ /assembly_acc=CAM_ASM_000170
MARRCFSGPLHVHAHRGRALVEDGELRAVVVEAR